MKSQVYRNLDKSFEVFGFNPIELMILSVVLVFGNEITQVLNIDKLWSIIFLIILAISMFWVRRLLGEMFVRRLIRFISLPRGLHPKIIKNKRNKN